MSSLIPLVSIAHYAARIILGLNYEDSGRSYYYMVNVSMLTREFHVVNQIVEVVKRQ